MGGRTDVLDRVLTDIPAADQAFRATPTESADQRRRFGGTAQPGRRPVPVARRAGRCITDLQALQCPLRELGRASPYLIGALKLILTQPFDIDTVPKMFRGDYMNVSLTLDVTYSAVDNAFLTGTGLSGALRALEQSFGRDPGDDDPRRPLHAEPERRARRTTGGKGGARQC